MSDDQVGSQDEALTSECLEACLGNLFEVPSKNIESAFGLVLGLIKEQSSQIDVLKRAHTEALEHHEEVRASMQHAVDELIREKGDLSTNLTNLKAEHDNLLKSCDKTTHIVEELRHEVETLAFNFLGDESEKQSEDEDIPDEQPEQQSLDTETEEPTLDTEAREQLPDNEAELMDEVTAVEDRLDEPVLETCTVEEVEKVAEADAKPELEPELEFLDTDCSSNVAPADPETMDTDCSSNVALADGSSYVEDNSDDEVASNETDSSDSNHSVAAGKADGSNTKLGLGWGAVGRIGVARVKAARKKKLDADRTVVARLDRLEQSLSSLVETKSYVQPTEARPLDEALSLEEISSRIHALETFLRGFGRADEANDSQHHVADKDAVVVNGLLESDSSDNDGASQPSLPSDGITNPTLLTESAPGSDSCQLECSDSMSDSSRLDRPPNASDSDQPTCQRSTSVCSQVDRLGSASITGDLERPGSARDSSDLVSRGSLLFHLNERETRTGLSIDDLARQVNSLRQSIQDHQSGQSTDPYDIRAQIAEIRDGLQRQVAELVVSVGNKVSSEDVEARIQGLCDDSLDNRHLPEESPVIRHTDASLSAKSDELALIKKQLMERVTKLETTKIDRDAFTHQLDQVERDLKTLLQSEISKQQLAISANAEKVENDLIHIKSRIDSQNDAMENLRDEPLSFSTNDGSMKEEEVNEKIQQATDALRTSLEERLDELRSVESEMDGLASKLAEKPSQDQIDSMLSDLERRLGQDEALQVILANMKLELKQRMTRGEVMALVKQTLREAKLGIQNTRDTIMIGRIPYCLGCSKPFPAGVNGTRAPKMNYDSLPPATGLVSSSTLYGAGNGRRNLRPLPLRSATHRPRPKSAIVGKFSSCSVRLRNNSR